MLEKAVRVEKFSRVSHVPECHFLRMAIWLRGLERWYLVLGVVAVGRAFEPQSDLELFFAEILFLSMG
jgi:hypothetical protein